MNTDALNPDPETDPDPAFQVVPDPVPDPDPDRIHNFGVNYTIQSSEFLFTSIYNINL
jgi:hypothetical protein